MSVDYLRELKSIGRDLSLTTPQTLKKQAVPPRTALVFSCPRSISDTGSHSDALAASQMLAQADFKVYYLVAPEYPQFYEWFVFFLQNTREYLSLVLTGYPLMKSACDNPVAHPLHLKDKDVSPSRIYNLITKNKVEGSRVTVYVNGCPAAESWHNSRDGTDTLAFSKTGTNYGTSSITAITGEVPSGVVVVTATPRLDVEEIVPRDKKNVSTLFSVIRGILENDPALDLDELSKQALPMLRQKGLELIVLTSSNDVTQGIPLLL